MTNEQNAKIASALAGYEVQVSPAGKWYVVTDEGTKPLVDYESDWHEAMSTLIAVCKSRGWPCEVTYDPHNTGCINYVAAGDFEAWGSENKQPSYIAHCLLQIAEGEE